MSGQQFPRGADPNAARVSGSFSAGQGMKYDAATGLFVPEDFVTNSDFQSHVEDFNSLSGTVSGLSGTVSGLGNDLSELENEVNEHINDLENHSSGREIDYAEITSNFTQTGVGGSDVTGLSISVPAGERPIVVEFNCGSFANSAATGLAVVQIIEGASTIRTGANIGPGPGTNVTVPVARKVRLPASESTRTFKIRLAQLISGNSVLGASSTSPAFIQAVEC